MTIRSFRPHYDAVVVGGRCAGAATAMLLARQGARVLVVERGQRGSDTLSTHALMRGGVEMLHRWGLLPAVAASGTPAVRQTVFTYGDREIPVRIRAEGGVDALCAPRRHVLDAILADAAEEAGAELAFGRSVEALTRDASGRVDGVFLAGGEGEGERVTAGLVIGADGVRSTVAAQVGAETLHAGRHATAVLFGYFPRVENRGYQWFFAPGATAGAIPTNGGETCVFVSLPAAARAAELRDGAEAAFRRILARVAPRLAEEIAGRTVRLRSFAGVRGHLRRAAGRGWALVGDAGYFKDPVTAHGITDAFRDAALLARAAGQGTEAAFADYQHLRDALSLPLMQVTDAIAACDWTLDGVAGLHAELNRAMKAEQAVMARLLDEPGPAALRAA